MEYLFADRWGEFNTLLVNRKSKGSSSARVIQVCTASRVDWVISKWTERPAFCGITMARHAIWLPCETSDIRSSLDRTHEAWNQLSSWIGQGRELYG